MNDNIEFNQVKDNRIQQIKFITVALLFLIFTSTLFYSTMHYMSKLNQQMEIYLEVQP